MPLPSVHPQSGDTESLDWDPQEGNRGTSDIQSGSQLTSEPAKEGEKPQFPEHLLCAGQAQGLTVGQTDPSHLDV